MASYILSASLKNACKEKTQQNRSTIEFDGRARNEIRMQDAINLLMLACASLAALAFGVLLAYGICRVAFAAMRLHVRSVALASQPQSESDSQIEAQIEAQTASL
jgi:hypothetical protein